MQWEELTSEDFARAVQDTGGVCLISLGVIERHGPHMPLGTDMLAGQHICNEAAKRESAIVFPPWFLGQIYEAKCFPGTVTIPPVMLVELLLTIFDEIGRNGFTRIIAYVAHGGNYHLAPLLAQCQLDRPRPYQLYTFSYSGGMNEQQKKTWKETLATDGGGHAGESETSIMLALRPELVKMEAVGDRQGERLGRMDHVKAGVNGFWWYGDFPEHWSGDARPASAEKGRILSELQIQALASFIKAVKNDQVTARLAGEFFQREAQLRSEP